MASICPVCRKNTFETVATPEGQRCAACGFVRLPVTDGLQSPVDTDLPSWIETILATAREEGSTDLLEIGCGSGRRLEQAAKLGFSVMGVEVDETSRDQARRRLPGTFLTGDLEVLPPHGFDFVLLTGILEATEDPYAPFHVLFAKQAITERTRVLLDVTLQGDDRPVRNIFSASALTALFQRLNFPHCEITEAPAEDGSLHLRCVAYGSHFSGFIQERFVPGTWSELIDYEHMPRYDYASRLAEGKRILDFGCGTGYGAHRLAAVAQDVLAVDIDEAALEYARASYGAENLLFQRNVDLAASLGEDRFDLITCFEVIEHISADKQLELVKNFVRLLRPDGVLLVSTPNPAVTALYGENPYHLHEMDLEEFRTLLSDTFPQVQVLLQDISVGVFLRKEDFPQRGELTCDGSLFPGGHNTAVYLAACAKRTLPVLPSVVYPDQARDFIAGHVEMLQQRDRLSLERLKRIQEEAQKAALQVRLGEGRAEHQARLAALEADYQARRVMAEAERDAERRRLVAVIEEAKARNAAISEQLQAITGQFQAAQEEKAALSDNLETMEAEQVELRRENAAQMQHQAMLQMELEQSRIALGGVQAQADHFRLRTEQIEHSTTWRAARRIQPLLAKARPVIRPPLRLAYRAYRRLHSRPPSPVSFGGPVEPVWQPRNMPLELRLEPVWNEAAGRYDLECDRRPSSGIPGGWVKPYHVVPFHHDGPAEKRILHIIPNVFVGGSTQLIIDLVQSLPRSFEHSILTAALWQGGAHTGVQVHHVPAPDPVAMARVLDEVRPDMVHVHYWGLTDDIWYHAALEVLRGRGISAVQNVNTPIAPLVDPVFGAYVFVSQYVLDHFGQEAMASGATVRVIHPGIDLSHFGGQDCAPDAHNAIGMVYRLDQDKLNEDSIDLLIEVVKRRPRTHAYVVGGGSLLRPYLERTERAGVRENFRFTGYVRYDSLPEWYEKFRIFVAPVWKESFGQVAPFAMSKGCAVAGYDIGALSEITGGHETLGRDLDEAARIIVQLLEDPGRLKKIGETNRVRVRKLFGLEQMIERYSVIYEQMLEK